MWALNGRKWSVDGGAHRLREPREVGLLLILVAFYDVHELTLRLFYSGHHYGLVAAVAEWYRYRTVACFVTGSSPVPLKTRRVGQRCTLNLSRAETSSRWCGVVVRRGGASSGVVHVT
ncbi:uncharacterized protein TNCV_3603441 [Trichonephila clavipes]|nr:uncharacterized protein TNCV_3603441 [Trichonephila clavipes]